MRALFVSLYADTPHFETELELIADLLDRGDDVTVLRCTGQLASCLKNPAHKRYVCRECVSKIDAGLRTLPRVRTEQMRDVAVDPRLPQHFASADELRSYSLDGAELGRGVYATVCGHAFKDPKFDTRRWAATIRTELEATYMAFANTRDAITKHRIDRVYIFNGRFATTHGVICAAQQAGIAYSTHERGGMPDRYLLRDRALPHDLALNTAEIEAVWADAPADKETIARRWFLERRNGVERAWPSFTKAQTVGLLPAGFDAKKHNIAVFNSTMEEYASFTQWRSPIYEDEVIGVARIARDLSSRPNTQLYLRVHPHLKGIPRDDNYQLRGYAELERTTPNLTVIWPESPVHTYELLDRASVALTFGSTVGAEACFWGTPSVLAGHALYEKLDCAHTPRDHDAVMALLTTVPTAKPQIGAMKYGYWETARGLPYRRFRPTGLFTGNWLDGPCKASLPVRLQAAVLSRLGR